MSARLTRRRNRKGEGGRLREELIEAARAVLAETGNEADLSIREVAGGAGVSPPAVYLHFADKADLVRAVLESRFADLNASVLAALGKGDAPAAALRAGCLAYLRFAQADPGSYRMLFDSSAPLSLGEGDPQAIPGREAFAVLTTGVDRCLGPGEDPVRVATLVWVGLHGMASLRRARPGFPWPPMEEQLDDLLLRLVGPRDPEIAPQAEA